MHPVRLAVRGALAAAASADALETARLLCSVATQMHQYVLLAWVLNRDARDPTLCVGRELWEIEELTGAVAGTGADQFSNMLKDASAFIASIMVQALEQLPLARLWEDHLPAHIHETEACFGDGLAAVQGVDGYLHPQSKLAVPLVYVPNLLDSYWCGYAVDAGQVRYVVGGPSNSLSAGLIRHEYAHLIVNPIVYAQAETLNETEQYMGRYAAEGDPLLRPYPTWPMLVAESLVEAVAMLADAPGPDRLADRVDHAVCVRHLRLAQDFVEELARVGRTEECAESFLPHVIRRVLESLDQAGPSSG
jgi:hypothetical protein